MDFITGSPKSEGKDSIFVVVDHLKNYAHFQGTQTTAKANKVAKIFIKEIYHLHGFPK